MTQTLSPTFKKTHQSGRAAKKAFVATALLAALGVAHAYEAAGDSTETAVVKAGGSTYADTHFHGPNGAPGISLDGSNYISLQSISLSYFLKGSESGFSRYYLDGYTHSDPGEETGPDVTSRLNWAKVPTTGDDAKQVYFGLVTNTSDSSTVGFYVGDREGYAVPTTNTNYTTVALLSPSGTDGTSPLVLQGTLQLDTANETLNSIGTHLVSGTNTLQIATNVTGGSFDGTSTYTTSTASASGSASGQFYGGGTSSGTSAVGGIASGTGYVAAFGGVAQ